MENQRRKVEDEKHALILQAQKMWEKGLSKTEISNTLAIPIKRLRRYLSGNAEMLCRDGRSYMQRPSSLDVHNDKILDMLKKEMPRRKIHYQLSAMGVKISYSTLCRHCEAILDTGRTTLRNPPVRHSISRKQIFDKIWSDKELDPTDDSWLSEKYPQLRALQDHVASFRLAFQSVASLECWISGARSSAIPAIRSFAAGLDRDKDAVLNAARFPESNAFLEGNVNRLKMVKRAMFGRAGFDLLSAKVLRQTAYW